MAGRASLCLCHGCSSCVGHAAVTAGDRRTVRSAQPAAAGRRPAARGAAPPEGKIATTLGAALATLASASRSSRLHCRLARAAAEACAGMGYAVVTLHSKVPDNARRDRAAQGAGASSRRSSRLRVWVAQHCARRRGLPTPATYVRRWPGTINRPRTLGGRVIADSRGATRRQMSNRDDGGVGRAARFGGNGPRGREG